MPGASQPAAPTSPAGVLADADAPGSHGRPSRHRGSRRRRRDEVRVPTRPRPLHRVRRCRRAPALHATWDDLAAPDRAGGPTPEVRALLAAFDAQRAHVLAALAGLDDDALRRAVLPSGWSCL